MVKKAKKAAKKAVKKAAKKPIKKAAKKSRPAKVKAAKPIKKQLHRKKSWWRRNHFYLDGDSRPRGRSKNLF